MSLLARTASSAAASSSGRCPVSPCPQPSRHRVVAAMMPPGSPMPEVNNDPEGLFKGLPMREGLIARRQMQRKVEVDKEFAKAMASAGDELRKEQLLRRETRRPPATHEEMIEYFLNTMAEDLEFEVARYRPRMTPDFFVYLDNILGAERFSPKPDEERLAELDLLRKYLAEAAEAVDKCVAATSSASERVKKLLMAKDKKAMILEMAAANEIDQALMDLLQQNIDQAKAAEQEEPAKFMEKVKLACVKYMISTQQAALPQVPDQLGSRAAGIPLLGQAQPAEPPASGGDAAPPAPPPAQKPARKARGGIILAPGQEPTPAGKLIY